MEHKINKEKDLQMKQDLLTNYKRAQTKYMNNRTDANKAAKDRAYYKLMEFDAKFV